jgi:hypothetical protein
VPDPPAHFTQDTGVCQVRCCSSDKRDDECMVDQARVLRSYFDGVDAVEAAAAEIHDWSAPTPCAAWSAKELAGHVLAVTGYFNGLLDAAESGDPRRDLVRGNGLEAMNARDLAALPDAGGAERVAEFAKSARRYGSRLATVDWLMVLGYWADLGPLTVAEHTGLAVGEWHIHAWDLWQSMGREYRPADPAVGAEARAALPGSFPGGDPWDATLAWSGRGIRPGRVQP